MLTIVTGAPGSGKSAATVDLLMEYAAKGRPIYVNGIPELKVAHVELSDADMRNWPESVPDGAVVVVDEAQRIWPAASAGARVPRDLSELNTHRHRGLDFIVVTQFPKLLHVNVRAVCGRHIHLRDVGILGRWWYEWPEATDVQQYRGAPVKKRYRLPKRAFSQYRSASLHVKPVRSMPASVFVLGFAAIAMVVLGVRVYANISEKTAPAAKAPAPAQAAAVAKAEKPVAVAAQAPAAAASEPATVAGCINFGQRCSCFDTNGWPVRVQWDMCELSSRGFGGVVAVNMERSQGGAVTRPASAAVPADVPRSYGFSAGDFRDRAPLPHVREPSAAQPRRGS
jgi:zona occludens toxin